MRFNYAFLFFCNMGMIDKQTEFLFAHLQDMADDAEKGIFRASGFFSPAELVHVRRWIASSGCTGAHVHGGYSNAERARVYFLPDYMTAEDTECITQTLSDYGYDDPTVILRIEGSGFRELTHRDFMGSVLSLGIERSVVGDIVADGKFAAYMFCDRTIAPFVCENLTKIANDAARVSEACLPGGNFGEREYREIRDTVASLRLDAVVASACNLSREGAKRAVTGGLCELNHEQTDSPDAEVSVGDVFSVRGYGKFRLASLGGENSRGRLRICIHKYV